MKINNKKENEFDIKGVINNWCGIMGIQNNIIQLEHNPIPILGTKLISAQQRTLTIDFSSEEGISKFNAEISNKSTLQFDDDYLYDCYLNGTPSITNDFTLYSVSYPLLVIKRKHQINRRLHHNDNYIKVESTCDETPCIYSIKVIEDVISIKIDGNIINNVKKDDVIILDGEKRKVTKNGYNIFDHCILKNNKFPFLKRGMNVIKLDTKIEAEIKYSPIFM